MFDRLILSCDDNHFIQFWPIVTTAWRKFFPDLKIDLAFVTEKTIDDPFVVNLKRWGNIHLFKPVKNIPLANLGQLTRHYLASTFPNEVCSIEDLDTIPLQKEWVLNRVEKRPLNKILVVGYEVYEKTPHEGKFPISTLTAEGYLFNEFLNPKNLNYEDLIKSWTKIRFFDKKEDIGLTTFQDESLLRALFNNYNIWPKVHKEIRNVDIKVDWVDRSWWNIDEKKLFDEKYVMCNFLRPFDQNFEKIEPLVRFVFGEKYDKKDILLIK